jgi:hypothetical protein
LVFVRPNLKVYHIALVANLCIRDHFKDAVVLRQAIHEHLVALVGQIFAGREATNDVP